VTFPLIQKYVEIILTATEEQIVNATKLSWERLKMVVEPSGSLPLAVILSHKDFFKGKRVGIINSGGNFSPSF
jgi:threonine dehydratase